MDREPYSRFKNEDLTCRDYLASDRTILANERTLLSYVRTSMAFAGGGAALIQFFDRLIVQLIGWALIPVAIAIMVVGIQRFLKMKRRLNLCFPTPRVSQDK
ncbi:MAG: DUF202 domain-containing protein [Dehalococcoidales bacterium]|nr:DUF202 domain-containing protein [Dehalococcoidales bacterium]